MKKCGNTNCGLVKPVTEFYKSSHTKDGYTYDCKSCHLATEKKWHQSTPEQQRQKRNNRHAKDPTKDRANAKRHRLKDPTYTAKVEHERAQRHYEKYREGIKAKVLIHGRKPETKAGARTRLLKLLYGLTPLQFDAMVLAQNGVCAICGKPPKSEQRLHVDHNHQTNLIGGLLCGGCNRAIGHLGDSLEGLLKAVAYLQRTG